MGSEIIFNLIVAPDFMANDIWESRNAQHSKHYFYSLGPIILSWFVISQIYSHFELFLEISAPNSIIKLPIIPWVYPWLTHKGQVTYKMV